MKTISIQIISLLILAIGFGNPTVNAQSANELDILVEYMKKEGYDLNKVMERKTWIPGPEDVVENLSDYFIIDIRTGDIAPKNGKPDFEDGHLPGAMNTSFENILKFAKSNNAPDRILVVSCDGQAAAAAAVALRVSGYPNTKVLKFGMSGWNKDFDMWTSALSTDAMKHKNWAKDKAAKTKTFKDSPELKTGKKNGKEILAAQVDAFLAKGFQYGIDPMEVLNNPKDYFVVNQGDEKAYGQYGIMKGAYQFNQPMLQEKANHGSLNNYPTDETIVQYCWTGHAAITTAAWMNLLGYNAKGVKYGVNGLIYDNLKKSQFKKAANLPYVSGK